MSVGTVEILMPHLQPGIRSGELLCWFKRAGQLVRPGESIAEIREGDKVTTIRSFDHGMITEIVAREGSIITVGAVVAKLQFNGNQGIAAEILEGRQRGIPRGVEELEWSLAGDLEDPDPFLDDQERFPESFE